MSLRLRSGSRVVRLSLRDDEAAGERILLRDRATARAFFAGLVREGHGRALRSLVGARDPVSPVSRADDAQLVDRLASLAGSGALWAARVRLEDLPYTPPGEEEPSVILGPAPEAAPEEEATAVDQLAQVATLIAAAKQGAPFCEECERRKRAREAAA